MLFLSGGIGVTPFISAIKSLTSYSGPALDVVLIASFKTHEESRTILPLLKVIESIKKTKSARVRVEVFVTTSDSDSTTTAYLQNVHCGRRITASAVSECVSDVRNRDCYLCGPDVFMAALSESLVSELGVKDNHVHTEDFTF